MLESLALAVSIGDDAHEVFGRHVGEEGVPALGARVGERRQVRERKRPPELRDRAGPSVDPGMPHFLRSENVRQERSGLSKRITRLIFGQIRSVAVIALRLFIPTSRISSAQHTVSAWKRSSGCLSAGSPALPLANFKGDRLALESPAHPREERTWP